jgi:Uma2 family endonuclease
MAIAELLDELFPIRIPAEAAENLAGFRAWVTSESFPEKWRASFFKGEILLEMSPEETETHNKVKGAVHYTLMNISRRSRLGTLYVDGVQLSNKAADLSTVPDAILVTRTSLRSGRVRRVHRKGRAGEYTELEGTPDLVIEVVSRSSYKKDTRELPILYYRAGIPEYWLIDALGDEIDFKLLRRGARNYIAVEPHRGWFSSPLFSRSFRLLRERDEDGDWQYELKSKIER